MLFKSFAVQRWLCFNINYTNQPYSILIIYTAPAVATQSLDKCILCTYLHILYRVQYITHQDWPPPSMACLATTPRLFLLNPHTLYKYCYCGVSSSGLNFFCCYFPRIAHHHYSLRRSFSPQLSFCWTVVHTFTRNSCDFICTCPNDIPLHTLTSPGRVLPILLRLLPYAVDDTPLLVKPSQAEQMT